MSDNNELKRLAEAANAVTGDVTVDITISSERGPNQPEIDAVTEFVGAATPAAVLALIAENDSSRKHWQNESNNVQALAAEVCRIKAELEKVQLIGRLAYNFDGYKAVLDERDQLRAEVAGLRTGYEAYEQVNAGLKAECEAERKDAERYRWYKGASDFDREKLSALDSEDADAYVDAAMGKGEKS